MLEPAMNVCVAGGLGIECAVDSRAGGKVRERVFVQPAAGNAGTALGAAFHAWHNFYGETKRVPLPHALPGPGLYRRRKSSGVSKIANCVFIIC